MAELFTEVFNLLPLAHCLSEKVLVRLASCYCKSVNVLCQKKTDFLKFLKYLSSCNAELFGYWFWDYSTKVLIMRTMSPMLLEAILCQVNTKHSRSMCQNLYSVVLSEILLFFSPCQVMHGGLFSDDTVTLDDIRKVERNRQPPDSGIMCELLWSDPQPQCGRSPSKRGVGVQFGPDITKTFLQRNSLDYIIRSHEVRQEGYEVVHDGKCITVFSAPNYW